MISSSSTIAGNSASSGNGGGIALDGGSLNSRNTIIALNTAPAGPDVNGTLTSQGFNFIGNSSGATIAPQFSDQIGGGDPSLGPLQDNGGRTPTRALLAGSKAIDK